MLINEKLNELKIQPVGNGLIDLICSIDNVDAFIDFCVEEGISIEGFSWWCHVTEGHEPCGNVGFIVSGDEIEVVGRKGKYTEEEIETAYKKSKTFDITGIVTGIVAWYVECAGLKAYISLGSNADDYYRIKMSYYFLL